MDSAHYSMPIAPPVLVHGPQYLHPNTPFPNYPLPQYPQLPPGVDPATLDYKTFFTYIPNEVRHRKRTSRAQLKVLEETFRVDQKPNPALRKCLAQQLDMSPRAVQVWFQNRRAKDKTLAKKALVAQQNATPGTGAELAQPSPTSDSHSVPTTPVDGRDSNSPFSPDGSDDSADSAYDPTRRGSAPGPVATPPALSPPSEPSGPDDSQLAILRRQSLPTTSLLHPPPRLRGEHVVVPSPARRKSLETNLQRLSSHPYAPVVAASTGALLGPGGRSQISAAPISFHNKRGGLHLVTADLPARSAASHHGAMSNQSTQATARPMEPNQSQSMPAPTINTSALQVGIPRWSHAFPTRLPSAPPVIPGPLPASDFSFGAATPVYRDKDSDGELHRMRDGEDDSPAFGPYSRFSSFASIAESDVSSASVSTFLSDAVQTPDMPRGWPVDERRASCPDHFVHMLSNLDVESNGDSFDGMHKRTESSLRYPTPGSTPGTGNAFRFPADSPALKSEYGPTRTRSELENALNMPGGDGKMSSRKEDHAAASRRYLRHASSGGRLEDAVAAHYAQGMPRMPVMSPPATLHHSSSAASSVSSLGVVTPLDAPGFGISSGAVDPASVGVTHSASDPTFLSFDANTNACYNNAVSHSTGLESFGFYQ